MRRPAEQLLVIFYLFYLIACPIVRTRTKRFVTAYWKRPAAQPCGIPAPGQRWPFSWISTRPATPAGLYHQSKFKLSFYLFYQTKFCLLGAQLPGRVVCLGSVLGISCGGSEQSVLLYVSFCPIEEDFKVLHPPPNRLGGFRPAATLQSRSQHLTAQASCPAPEVILPCSPESFLSDCGASTAPVQKG